jgi:hypothetical protein
LKTYTSARRPEGSAKEGSITERSLEVGNIRQYIFQPRMSTFWHSPFTARLGPGFFHQFKFPHSPEKRRRSSLWNILRSLGEE